MKRRKHFLVVNDDGIDSPGLRALASVAAQFGTVRVVAPLKPESSVGEAIKPEATRCRRTSVGRFEAYELDGTPSDCVVLGAHLWTVDTVLAGINIGFNLGSRIAHSGTVAAIRQAALLGLRGIAISTAPTVTRAGLRRIEAEALRLLPPLLAEEAPRLVNVNVPSGPRGAFVARQSLRRSVPKVVLRRDRLGMMLVQTDTRSIAKPAAHSDEWCIANRYVAITPLACEFTDLEAAQRLSSRI